MGDLGEPKAGPGFLSTLADALALPLQPALAKSPCPLPNHSVNPRLPFWEAAGVEGSPPEIQNPQQISEVHSIPARQVQSCRNAHNATNRKFEGETNNYCPAK